MCETCIEAIETALDDEHPCDDVHGCDIAQSLTNNWVAWAAHLFQGATESPKTDAAVGEFVIRHGLAAWEGLCEKQRGFLSRVEHLPCPHCNTTVWDPSDVELCPNCEKSLDSWFVIPVSITDEDDCTTTTGMIFRAKGRDAAEGDWKTFGSFEDLVGDGGEAVWGKAIAEAYKGNTFEHDGRGAVYNCRPCDCGDTGCADDDTDHDSLSVLAQWPANGWPSFATREEAETHAQAGHSSVKFVNAE